MSTASHSLCVESPPLPAKPWLFPINPTNLDAGAGTDADVMPGLTFGLRF